MLKDTGKLKSLWKRFSNIEYRYAYLDDRIRESIASQVYFIRESRKLTQSDLADLAGTRQPAISRIEKGEASLSIKSLTSIARALDVALSIKFVPFSEMAEEVVDGRIEAYVAPFSDDYPASIDNGNNAQGSEWKYTRIHTGKSFSRTNTVTATSQDQLVRAG